MVSVGVRAAAVGRAESEVHPVFNLRVRVKQRTHTRPSDIVFMLT